RLTQPLVRRDGELRPADWDTAMGAVVERCGALLESHGPGAIGFYTTGQLFAEEYYTLATIARAGIGTAHLDGNTRPCTATAGDRPPGTAPGHELGPAERDPARARHERLGRRRVRAGAHGRLRRTRQAAGRLHAAMGGRHLRRPRRGHHPGGRAVRQHRPAAR